MAKFVFKLQSFLDLREKLEDQKKLEYGQALARLEEQRNIKERLVREKADCIALMRDVIIEKVRPADIQRYNRYIELLEKKIIKQNLEIVKAEEFAESKRLELVEAMKERKMLETLKDKNYAEYLTEEKRAEQKITDEVVSYRYNVNRE